MTADNLALQFMQAAPRPLNGSSAWASRYADDIRHILTTEAAHAPRSLQQHLGPSELGVDCHRQVAGKMAALPATNHVTDPWPAIMGTAGHAWAAQALISHNKRTGRARFAAEVPVTGHPDHPGTSDGYDVLEHAVIDWKFLGDSSMQKVRSAAGPPRKYVVQFLIYANGFRALGLRVDRVVLIALPRTKSTLDSMYVWDRPHTPADDALLAEVFEQTAYRRAWADAIIAQTATINDVPAIPDDSECYFCPFYRPQVAQNPTLPGCAGTALLKGSDPS